MESRSAGPEAGGESPAERAENAAEFLGLVRRIGGALGAGLFFFAAGLIALKFADTGVGPARKIAMLLGAGAALYVLFRRDAPAAARR